MTTEEWAKIPTVAPYVWEAWRNGVLARAERTTTGRDEPVTSMPSPPFLLLARPLRAEMPAVATDILAGQEVIWLHHVKMVYPAFGDGPTRFEMLVCGRRHPDGREEVWQVFPDGKVATYLSLAEALA